jgi:hypothetical protein
MVRRQPETFCRTLIIRISRSAGLLSLFRHPDKDNYADGAVMPMFAAGGGAAAGQGGALAA